RPSAGEGTLAPRGTPHSFWNATARTTRYLVVTNPKIAQLNRSVGKAGKDIEAFALDHERGHPLVGARLVLLTCLPQRGLAGRHGHALAVRAAHPARAEHDHEELCHRGGVPSQVAARPDLDHDGMALARH